MLKIQASCFFLLGSDRERQSLHRDLLRRILHKSAPSAALPAAARPGGDRWRIVPAFLHRASAGAEAVARRRGPTQTGDLSPPGKGLARDRRGMNGPRLAEVPALPDGAAAGEAPAQALPFLARERSAGASSAPGSPKAPLPAPVPAPRLRLEPRHRSPPRLPSLHPAPSAIPPRQQLTLARGTRGPSTWALLLFPQRQKRFLARPQSLPGELRRAPQGQEAAGVAKARRAAQERCSFKARPQPAGSPPSRSPPPSPSFGGRLRSLNTPYSTGATRAIFTASLQARGARGGRGCPSPPRLLLHVFWQGNLCRFTSAGPNTAGGWSGGAQRLPEVVPRRALPASSAEDLFTSNYQKINVLRTALLICYN